MSDFLVRQILLNVSDTLNIKQNTPNPNKTIKVIVLIHFIIFVCIPSLFGVAGSLTWPSAENYRLSLAEAKDSGLLVTLVIKNSGVHSRMDLPELFSKAMTFFVPITFFLKIVSYIPRPITFILTSYTIFNCLIWIDDILYPSQGLLLISHYLTWFCDHFLLCFCDSPRSPFWIHLLTSGGGEGLPVFKVVWFLGFRTSLVFFLFSFCFTTFPVRRFCSLSYSFSNICYIFFST